MQKSVSIMGAGLRMAAAMALAMGPPPPPARVPQVRRLPPHEHKRIKPGKAAALFRRSRGAGR